MDMFLAIEVRSKVVWNAIRQTDTATVLSKVDNNLSSLLMKTSENFQTGMY